MNPVRALKNVLAFTTGGSMLVLSTGAWAKPVGIDVSNKNGSVNWTAAYNNSNIRFGFSKDTEGEYIQDGTYHNNMSNGKLAGCLMGAYAFARPDLDDPQNEANY